MSEEEKEEEAGKETAEENSVADEIAAAFDAQEESAQEETEESSAVEAEKPEESAQEKTAEEGAEEEETIEPLHHWPEPDKEIFRAQPVEARKWLLDKSKSIEAGYTEKFQDVAGLKKAMEPWEGYLRQLGNTPEAAFGQMMAVEHMFRTGTPQQKREALNKVIQDYGIELDQAEEEDLSDPQIAAVKQELDTLKGQIASQAETQQEAQQNDMLLQIQAFSDERTEAGEPAHPHFEQVMGRMVEIAKFEISSGRKPDLKVLYDQAIWGDPTARASMLKAQKEADGKASAEAAREKATKAGKAASSVSGAPAGQASVGKTTLEDDLNAAYDEHAA